MNGYVITKTGREAFQCFEESDEGVRFAAHLNSGEGFVAFEGEAPPCEGRVLAVVDPTPDDEWWWFLIPKRRIANGLEHFTLIGSSLPTSASLFMEDVRDHEEVKGIAVVEENGFRKVLIESDVDVSSIGRCEWTARAIAVVDTRETVDA